MLIGRAGETILGLQQRTGAKVTFGSKEDAPLALTRAVIIVGTLAQIDASVAGVEELLEEFWRGVQASRLAAAGASPTDQTLSQPMEVRVYLPVSLVGNLIGKAGANIKDLNEKIVSARVRVDSNSHQHLAMKEVTITGTPTGVLRMEREIETRLAPAAQQQGITTGVLTDFYTAQARAGPVASGFPPAFPGSHGLGGHHLPHGPIQTVTIRVPNDSAGLLIGKGGATIRELQETAGAKIVVSREPGGDGMRAVEITGDAHTIKSAQIMIAARLNSLSSNGAAQPGLVSGAAHYAPPGMPGYGGVGAPISTESYTMLIPSSAVGCVVGKKGASIQEIKRAAQVMVKVNSGNAEGGNNGSDHVEVIITGTPTGIYAATHLIQAKVLQSQMPRDQHQGDASHM